MPTNRDELGVFSGGGAVYSILVRWIGEEWGIVIFLALALVSLALAVRARYRIVRREPS